MQADILALQSLTVAPNELPRVPVSPRGKLDITQGFAGGLGTAEVKSRAIDKELRQVVQLGNGFLYVARISRAG